MVGFQKTDLFKMENKSRKSDLKGRSINKSAAQHFLADAVAASVAVCSSLTAIAQSADSRENEIFGESGSAPSPSATVPSSDSQSAPEKKSVSGLADSLQVGGRLEYRTNTSQEEQQKLPNGSFSQLKTGDIYFDSRPNEDVRTFLRFRLSEQTPASSSAKENSSCTNCLQLDLDELWFKWDLEKTVFLTIGKQHLKWGSGRFWNPTDFTATETRDPFSLFDRRLGQTLFKIHLPIEKQNFNYYAIVQFDDMARNKDVGAALRAEFAFAGQGEFALSVQGRHNQALRYGADLSSAVGPVDIYIESALTTHQQRYFYTGELNPSAGKIPVQKHERSKYFTQVVGGIEKTWQYSSEDNITVGLEYFYNQLGYKEGDLELYSLLAGQSQSLYAGRQYGAATVRVPTPGNWNKTSFYINGIENFSDKTGLARLTATQTVYNEITIEGYVSRCFGDYGELCFRIPEKYREGLASPFLSPAQKQQLASLPTRRTKVTAGLGLSMNF